MPHAGPRSRPFVCLAVMLAITASPVAAQSTPDTSLAARLVGSWTVDLRPTPDAPAYDKEFVIETVTGRDFTGRFYDTPIENGKINADWGEVHLSFVSRDGSGPYNHAAVLKDGRMVGQSHSLGRDFLLVWRAKRLVPATNK